jgi:hypothetical protein
VEEGAVYHKQVLCAMFEGCLEIKMVLRLASMPGYNHNPANDYMNQYTAKAPN